MMHVQPCTVRAQQEQPVVRWEWVESKEEEGEEEEGTEQCNQLQRLQLSLYQAQRRQRVPQNSLQGAMGR
jgi:hypothetical protein